MVAFVICAILFLFSGALTAVTMVGAKQNGKVDTFRVVLGGVFFVITLVILAITINMGIEVF